MGGSRIQWLQIVASAITILLFLAYVVELSLFGVQRLLRPERAQVPPVVVVIERIVEPIQELPDNVKLIFHRLR